MQNPIYIGEVKHRDEQYPAQHGAIIAREQFNQVQALIASSARTHRIRVGAEHINLLAGLLIVEAGNRFTSAHSSKKGVRYRYYVGSDPSQTSQLRIPAGEIETRVIESLVANLNDRQWLRASILAADASPDEIRMIEDVAAQVAGRVRDPQSIVVHEALNELVDRIELLRNVVRIHLQAERLTVGVPDLQDDEDRRPPLCVVEVANPSAQENREQHLIVTPDSVREQLPIKWHLKAIARSITWYDELVSGNAASFEAIAKREGVSRRYIAQLLPLAFLDPQLPNDCVEGRLALSLTAADFAQGVELPAKWADQRA